jgi:hypothetical protein
MCKFATDTGPSEEGGDLRNGHGQEQRDNEKRPQKKQQGASNGGAIVSQANFGTVSLDARNASL